MHTHRQEPRLAMLDDKSRTKPKSLMDVFADPLFG
jgi:hypothetical protein